jgi:glutathione S-transferase
MRAEMPMDFLGRVEDFAPAEPVAANIERICRIWSDARNQFGDGGSFLFGSWSIADAMFAPVVSRFRTYGVQGGSLVDDYMAAVCATPDWVAWEDACRAEMQQS